MTFKNGDIVEAVLKKESANGRIFGKGKVVAYFVEEYDDGYIELASSKNLLNEYTYIQTVKKANYDFRLVEGLRG